MEEDFSSLMLSSHKAVTEIQRVMGITQEALKHSSRAHRLRQLKRLVVGLPLQSEGVEEEEGDSLQDEEQDDKNDI